MSSRIALWIAFTVFMVTALVAGWHDQMFTPQGPLGAGKLAVWVVFLGFLTYTAWCSVRENLFRSVATMWQLHWGRQVGFDLYLGLLLMGFVVYLHEGAALVTLAWLLSFLVFGNLATLLYLAINYDALVARFIA